MDAPTLLRIQARANRLANHRLHAALAGLPPGALHAPRIGFFPSLMATLNHILEVDLYYVGALCGEAGLADHWARYRHESALAPLAARQAASDERLIAFCDVLDPAGCDAPVPMPRASCRVQRDAVGHVLAHLHMHQTHHRGQLHAMLSGTAVAPPQLDEFLMPSDAALRRADMDALGWSEGTIVGPYN